jgi:hypothetical protein
MENGEVLCRGCRMVGAEVPLPEELLRRHQNGDTTEGDVAKDMQTDSRHLIKRTDNLERFFARIYKMQRTHLCDVRHIQLCAAHLLSCNTFSAPYVPCFL